MAFHIGQSEVGRFERLQIIRLHFGTRAEIPGGECGVVRDGLMQHSGEGAQVEPLSFISVTAARDQEFCFAIFREREAELFAADALGLEDETCGAG